MIEAFVQMHIVWSKQCRNATALPRCEAACSMRWRKPVLFTSIGATALLLLAWKSLQRFPGGASYGPRFPSQRPGGGPGFQFEYDKFCDTAVNLGGWIGFPFVSCDTDTQAVATCGPGLSNNWQWSSDALRCGAHRLGPSELRGLLQQQWVVVAGDSITRFFFAALLRRLAESEEQQIVFGHQDFEYNLPGGIRASFVWAPYAANLTTLLATWSEAGLMPDALVLSFGLWHMLHISDPPGYLKKLVTFKAALEAYLAAHEQTPLPVTFFTLTEVFPPKLRSDEKRRTLTLENVDAYNRAIAESEILVPRGPCYLLDMHHLTQGCGPECTQDGLHYSNATYDAALQIWANNLQILAREP